MTLDAVRRELKGVKGKRYWRSVDELAGTAEFQAAVEREFHEADGRVDGPGRPCRMHQAAR